MIHGPLVRIRGATRNFTLKTESSIFNFSFHLFLFRLYYAIGWGLPVVQTAVWAVVTGTNMNTACWYGYNHTDYYYIVEGPRLAVIAVSTCIGGASSSSQKSRLSCISIP